MNVWIKWAQDKMEIEKLDTSGMDNYFKEFTKREEEKLCEFKEGFSKGKNLECLYFDKRLGFY